MKWFLFAVLLVLATYWNVVESTNGSLRVAGTASAKSDYQQKEETRALIDVDHELPHSQLGKHRELQQYYYDPDESACGITGFSIYNKTSNLWRPLLEMYFGTVPKTQVLLDTYPNEQINIMVHTSNAGCPTRVLGCVKMQFGDFYARQTQAAPFTLYSSDVQSQQVSVERPGRVGDYFPLQVWVYEGYQCSGTPICSENLQVNLISKRTDTTQSQPVHVEFQGASAPPRTSLDTQEMFTATCAYVKMAINENYLGGARSSLTMNQANFQCTNLWSSSQWLPLKIVYQVQATFTYRESISAFSNPVIPQSEAFTNYLKRVFRNEIVTITGSLNETMRQYVKRTVSSSNPYWSYTSAWVQ